MRRAQCQNTTTTVEIKFINLDQKTTKMDTATMVNRRHNKVVDYVEKMEKIEEAYVKCWNERG